MNKTLIFLIIATSILVLSAIVICIAPIINNIEVEITRENGSPTTSVADIWRPEDWKNLNCQFYSDVIKIDTIPNIDTFQKLKKFKNICYRQKVMYGLENSVFIINIILAFICADLTLLHYLNVGKSFEKKTGLVGLISGIIGLILTLLYVCYSGYIFNNDVAFGIINEFNFEYYRPSKFYLPKLYPNGALYKFEVTDSISGTGNYIKVSEKEKGEYPAYLLYKDLGKKQYNYNTEYYQTYMKKKPGSDSGRNDCNIGKEFTLPTPTPNTRISNCDYLYYYPKDSCINKYIYDRWLTALILAVFIVICNVALAIFGFLLFKSNEESAPLSEQTPVIYKK